MTVKGPKSFMLNEFHKVKWKKLEIYHENEQPFQQDLNKCSTMDQIVKHNCTHSLLDAIHIYVSSTESKFWTQR